jgi:haloacetate dehalogenase
MTTRLDLFPGYAERRIKTDDAEIFLRTAGSGPALLLLHGYPQTHVCWHKIAAELARHCTLVLADLRGYGASSVPPDQVKHLTYAKRTMAQDCLAVMRQLGHQRFMVGGHDRGGRVAYRLTLDHPEAVSALLAIDVIPTGEVWRRLTAESAVISYHWGFLAQPAPVPERLIGGDPDFYLEHTLKSWSKPGDLSPFSAEALEHYRALLREPARLHAICEDYRAGATIDRQLDDADVKAGRKISCPTFLAWGSDYLGKRGLKPLQIWRSWCNDLSGAEIPSGHFLAEENPGATLAALLPFIAAQGAAR